MGVVHDGCAREIRRLCSREHDKKMDRKDVFFFNDTATTEIYTE